MTRTYAIITYKVPTAGIERNIYVTYDATPSSIWDDIKQAIEEVKNDEYNEGIELNHETLYDRILAFDDYEEKNKNDDCVEYFCTLTYCYDKIEYEVENIRRTVVAREKYIFRFPEHTVGNCVDDFIRRGVQPLQSNINDCVEDITSRVDERSNILEYHRTFCYEKDFTQVSMIRKYAKKLVENCDKHLEKISEFYTKLNY